MTTTTRSLALLVLALGLGSGCAPKAERGVTAHASPKPAAAAAPIARVDVDPLDVTWSPEEMSSACTAAESEADARLASLVAIPDADRTFQNTALALESATADYAEKVARLTFMKSVHTDAAVREAAGRCEERAGKYAVALGARKDLYKAMKGWLANPRAREALDAEQKKLVDVTMRDFRRNGLELADSEREKLVAIRQRITELETKFSTHLTEDKSSIELTKAELAGMTDEFLARLKKTPAGKYVVTTKYPDYYPVLENATVEATRRKLEVAFMNRGGPEQIALLDEAVKLRQQAARMLRYATHMDYVAEPRMARDAKTVGLFIDRMRAGLAPGLTAEREKMQALKAKETGKKDAKIHAWDWRYYLNRIKRTEYAIDDEQIRAHFPTDKVMAGMFEVYERLFGIDIQEDPAAPVWADGVKHYQVIDATTHERIARFYVDPFPRDGKYGHAAEFGLSTGRETARGYKIPFAALVMNFSPPSDGEPSRLKFEEVRTLFHEFGHVMHESLTTARYATLSGTNVARDFVEAPSQMLENWIYRPEVLALLSASPTDPSKPLPPELAQKLIAARRYNAGTHYSRQVFLASFDRALHASIQPPGAEQISRDLWAMILGFDEDPKSRFPGTFGHMMGGYDGGYYGYLWSEVFAADMFTRFQAEGVLNPTVGRAYRDIILARGRVEEPDVLLKRFLGREPNEEAFLLLTGIKKSS